MNLNIPSGINPAPEMFSSSPPARASFLTVSSFTVSVPVLSVAIKVHEPSASTVTSFRAITFRFAIRLMAIESAIVIATGKPSGIAATAKAAITIMTWIQPIPWVYAAMPINSDAISIRTVIRKVNLSMRINSGGLVLRRASNVSAIRPSWVWIPVWEITPTARPVVTSVPVNAILLRSATGVSAFKISSWFLLTGNDSPVSKDSSI